MLFALRTLHGQGFLVIRVLGIRPTWLVTLTLIAIPLVRSINIAPLIIDIFGWNSSIIVIIHIWPSVFWDIIIVHGQLLVIFVVILDPKLPAGKNLSFQRVFSHVMGLDCAAISVDRIIALISWRFNFILRTALQILRVVVSSCS